MPRNTGTTIRPAPCAEAIRKDHKVRPRAPTRMLAQRGCRCRKSRPAPKRTSVTPTSQRRRCNGTTMPASSASKMAAATAKPWPRPRGNRAPTTAPRRRSCIPSATANNHPMPGLIPWNAPRPNRVSHDTVICPMSFPSGKAVGIGRGITGLQVNLVGAEVSELQKQIGVESNATSVVGIELCHPAANSVRIELLIPAAVERVGDIDPLPITADLDHLRTAIQGTLRVFRASLVRHDAAQLHRSAQYGIEGV